ncbi:MAG: hypothetical protein AAF497_19625, partial [Planctomycetota bacterium]
GLPCSFSVPGWGTGCGDLTFTVEQVDSVGEGGAAAAAEAGGGAGDVADALGGGPRGRGARADMRADADVACWNSDRQATLSVVRRTQWFERKTLHSQRSVERLNFSFVATIGGAIDDGLPIEAVGLIQSQGRFRSVRLS